MEFLDQQINPPASWEKFEEVCRALFAEIWDNPTAQLHGRSGQKQHGVDIHGARPTEPGKILGVQCKGKDRNFGEPATAKEFDAELAKAEKFTPPLAHWTFVTTYADDAALLAHARAVSVERVATGKFPVEALGWGNLQSLMAKHPSVIEQFYPELGAQLPQLVGRLSALHGQLRSALETSSGARAAAITDALPADKRAARALIKETGKRLLERLAFLGFYKTGRTIDRDSFDLEWRRFVAGDKMVWPVIGMSGVGKTSALAHLLGKQKASGPTILLVQASEIRAHHDSIADLLSALPWPSETAAPRAILGRLDKLGMLRSTIILLDGLNEADHAFLRASWIPNSLNWLRSTGARLVLSCRPESWVSLESAFPSALLHRLPSEPPATPAAPAKEPDYFRLSDFTDSEAESAATAYGFEGGSEVITHPFLLAIAAELDAGASLHSINHLTALDAFIQRRISRALDRLAEPSWLPDIERCLSDVAGRMYRRHLQALPADEWMKAFDGLPGAVHRLAEEHLILKSETDYRFQFDQVRELLQARSLTPADLLSELLPLPMLTGHTPYATGFAALFNALRAIDWRRRFKSRGDGKAPAINAALAGIVVVRCAIANDPNLPKLLDALYEATEFNRLEPYAEWAALVVQAVLQYAPADLLDEPRFVDWLRRQLDRYDINWYREWPETIVRAIVAYLVRSPARIPLKQSFLQAVILREHDGRWYSQNISNRAHFDRYWAKSPPEERAFTGFLSEMAAGQLVEHLVESAPDDTIRQLASFLPLKSPGYRERGRQQAEIAIVAAKCLFSIKMRDLPLVVALAVESHGIATADLIEGLAVSNADAVARYCLDQFAASDVPERRIVYLRSIWKAARHVITSDVELDVAKFALGGLFDLVGEEAVWATRIFCERNLPAHRYWSEHPEEYADVLESYRSLAQRAAMYLRVHIQENDREYVQSCDYEYLLELDFDEGLARLDLELATEDGISREGIGGIRKYVGPNLLAEPGRVEKHHRIVELLHRYLDRHGEKAGAHIAAFVIRTNDRSDSLGEFSGQQVIDLGFLDLACRIIAIGGQGTFDECGNFRPPLDDTIRRRILEAIRDSDINGDDLDNIVWHCWSEKGFPRSQSFDTQLIFALRQPGKEKAWDDGARRYLYLHHKDQTLSREIVAFWRGLPVESLTPLSRHIIEREDDGWEVREAAMRS